MLILRIATYLAARLVQGPGPRSSSAGRGEAFLAPTPVVTSACILRCLYRLRFRAGGRFRRSIRGLAVDSRDNLLHGWVFNCDVGYVVVRDERADDRLHGGRASVHLELCSIRAGLERGRARQFDS